MSAKEGWGLIYPLSYLVQRCLRCQVRKPATHLFFPKDNRQSKGVRSICKECTNARVRWKHHNDPKRKEYKKHYRKKNKQKIKEYQKIYVQENKEKIQNYKRKHYSDNKEQYQEYGRDYRKINAKQLSEKRKEHYRKNRDRILKERKEYYEKNIERIKKYRREYVKEGRARASDQRKRAKRLKIMRSLPMDYTYKDWEETLAYFDYCCCYCGKYLGHKLEQDHFIPVMKRGAYTKDNIVPSCKSCNSSKNTKDFAIWYLDYKHYSIEREHTILDYIELRKSEKTHE